MNRIDHKRPATYDGDFALWAAEQGALLRAGKLDRLDVDNVAEEIESLGRSDKYEIESRRLSVLLMHLLKWEFQPGERSNSWKATIRDQRYFIKRKIADSPSLAGHPAATLAARYDIARSDASGETGLPEAAFPAACPYTAEQALDDAFWPGAK